MTSVYGACFWRFNSPGCFLFARVLKNGRVYIQQDLKFVRKPVETVAREIRYRLADLGFDRFASVYGNVEMFPKFAPAKRVIEAETPSQEFARYGVPMTPAGSNHLHGWNRVHDYLRDAPDGSPWLIVDPSCSTLARTLPSLVQSKTDPDDCEGDTYAAHALRVLLSARPSPQVLAKTKPAYPYGTVGWLRQQDEREQAPRGLLR